MFKKIVALAIATMSTSAFAGQNKMLRGPRNIVETYHALTYIISTETPAPVSRAESLDLLKNHTSDALAEVCFFAGALQLRLNNIFVKFPSSGQAPEPLRSQLQSLIESGQKSLRDVCVVSDANKKLPALQRVTAVENIITDIRNEAINLRTKVPIH